MGKRLVRRFYKHLKQIGEDNIKVKVNESKFGKNKYHRERTVKDVWLLSGVERTQNRRIFLKTIKKRNKCTINSYLIRFVKTNSLILFDEWRGYNDVKKIFKKHQTVNHSKFYKDPITGVYTNIIEGNWSMIKKCP